MICLLGLGASVGEHLVGNRLRPAQQRLQQASHLLQQLPRSRLMAQSALYHSRAWGNLRAGAYLNAAALLQTRLPPGTLLRRLLDIEFVCGRRRQRKRWGKRALDIDVLLLGSQQLQSNQLQVPHTWLWQREFALRPALDVLRTLSRHDDADSFALIPRTWPGSIARRLTRLCGYHLHRPLRILSAPA